MSRTRFLSVNADLTMTVGNEIVKIRGDAGTVTLEFRCFSALYKILRDTGHLGAVRKRLSDFSGPLANVGLSIIIRTPSKKLMTLGKDGRSALMKLLGFPNTRLHLR